MNRLRQNVGWMAGPLLRGWRKLSSGWVPYVEEPLPEAEVTLVMEQASIPSFGFFFMLGLASAIATFGMLANSALRHLAGPTDNQRHANPAFVQLTLAASQRGV